jgi:hypothetical protein
LATAGRLSGKRRSRAVAGPGSYRGGIVVSAIVPDRLESREAHMSLNRRSTMLTLAAAVVGAAASLVITAPAMAVPGLIVTIDWSSATASEPFKSANAVCPAGKVLLGGGADIVTGGSEVRLTSMVPSPLFFPTHSYLATAREDDSYAGNWTMYAWAICGTGVTGWQVVSHSGTASAGTNILGIGVSCPAGKKVIGTGGAATGGSHFVLNGIAPSAALTNVKVEIASDETASGPFGGNAYAICVNPVPGQQRVAVTSAESSVNKLVTATCPAGTKLHGTGADNSGGDQVYLDRVGLFGPGAVSGSDVAVHEDQTGYSENWSATAYAICAN